MGRKIGAAGLTQHNEKFYGNYRGEVLSNEDPLKLGRIKVRIFPMLAGITDPALLPWAVPAMPLSSGAGEDFGTFCVPEVGANVWVFLEAGDIYQPVYFAEATDGVKGLPVGIIEDYPNTTVMETKTGIIIKINRKSGSEDILVEHPSGSSIQFAKDGTLLMTTNTQINLVAESSVNIQAPETIVVGSLRPTNMFNGSFTTGDGKVADVVDGIIKDVL